MSGPALRNVDSHRAIHDMAWREAEEALRLARAAQGKHDSATFTRVVEVFVEIVEARILVHASEEERGLYQEVLQEHPEQRAVFAALRAEHDALRHRKKQIEQAMQRQEGDAALDHMDRLLEESDHHSRHEEDVLRTLFRADDTR